MWLIQNKDILGSETETLLEKLSELEIAYYMGKEKDSTFWDAYPYFPQVIRGSVEWVTGQQEDYGLGNKYITLKNYNCNVYYPHYLAFLLNRDHFFVSYGTLVSDIYNDDFNYFDWLKNDSLFIRPNSGKKIFTGNYITKKWFTRDFDSIMTLPGNTEPDDEELILVSSYKDISAECRVLMHKLEPISSAYYNIKEHWAKREQVEDFARKAARVVNWYPDDYWVMDVAVMDETFSDDEFKIVEINNLFTAGWYDCNYDKVIKYIRKNR